MKDENYIIDQIINLESELFDEECYLDESQQSRLHSFYEILNRELTSEEKNKIIEERKSKMEDLAGEYIPEILNQNI
tara:strand:+ start:1409 stop:1639 length:231 start_codon:yes stop_codon:yes gene_type:complete